MVERGTPTVAPELPTPPQNVGQTSPNFIKRPYGALAQLEERTTSCASPVPTPQVGELAQKINTKFGALAQLVERTTFCASPAPTPQVGELAQKINTKFGALAQLVARYIRIVEVTGSNPVCSTPKKSFLTRVRELFSFSRSTQKLGMRMYCFLLDNCPLVIRCCCLVMKPANLLLPRFCPVFGLKTGIFRLLTDLVRSFLLPGKLCEHLLRVLLKGVPP